MGSDTRNLCVVKPLQPLQPLQQLQQLRLQQIVTLPLSTQQPQSPHPVPFSYLTSLPPELIESIASCLPLHPFLALLRTSRQLYHVLSTRNAWASQLDQVLQGLDAVDHDVARAAPKQWRVVLYALGYQIENDRFVPSYHWSYMARIPDLLASRRLCKKTPVVHRTFSDVHGANGCIRLAGTSITCVHTDGFGISFSCPTAGRQRFAATRLQWMDRFLRINVPTIEWMDEGKQLRKLVYSGWARSSYTRCPHEWEEVAAGGFVHADVDGGTWNMQARSDLTTGIAFSLRGHPGRGINLRVRVVVDTKEGKYWLKLTLDDPRG